MQQHRTFLALTRLCRLLQLSRSAYYAWLNQQKREQGVKTDAIEQEVKLIYHRVKGYAGYRMMTGLLGQQGILATQHQVRRIMHKLGLKSKHAQKGPGWRYEKAQTTALPNSLNRQFSTVTRPNAVWVGDMTYLKVGQRWVYLAMVLDVYSRKIMSWSVADEMKTSLINEVLTLAFYRRHQPTGVVFHSDRGSQYLSASYRRLLHRYGLQQSVSRAGNCWDNAVAESFFKTLKSECVNRSFSDIKELKQTIGAYIEVYYNLSRPHSFNNYLSPEEKERLYYRHHQHGLFQYCP